MGKKNGRYLFSDKDGTKFKEDWAEISEEARLYLVNVLLKVKDIGEDVLEYTSELTEKVKEAVAHIESLDFDVPLFDIIVQGTKWEGDDIALAWLRNGGLLQVAETILDEIEGSDLDEIVAAILEFIASLTPAMQGKTLLQFNSGLLRAYYVGELETVEADLIVQGYYMEKVRS